jgi:hypothetical protein
MILRRWRAVLRHLLRDHAAERESEDVAGGYLECVQKGEGMTRHPGNRVGHLTRRPSHARAVEQNDFSPGGKRIGDRRVPIVERSREVLKE